MEDEIVCPQCQSALNEREIVLKSWTFESCPHCGAEIRKRESFQWTNPLAILQEDVDTIAQWLDEVAETQHLVVTPNREKEGQGDYLWTIADPKLVWSCEVYYSAKRPNIVEIRLISDKGINVVASAKDKLPLVCADHGVQAYGDYTTDLRTGEVTGQWGALQLINTSKLPPELFVSVSKRLAKAMEDATVTFGFDDNQSQQ
jgi:hypothetical protein